MVGSGWAGCGKRQSMAEAPSSRVKLGPVAYLTAIGISGWPKLCGSWGDGK